MDSYIFIIIGIFIVLLIAVSIIYSHNRKLLEIVEEHWQSLWLLLYKRHNFLPNLLETFKGFLPEEKKIFNELIDLKGKAAVLARPNLEKLHAEFDLSKKMAELMDKAGASKELMADTNFLELKHELKQNSYKVEGALSTYNERIRDYNSFLRNWFARPLGAIFRWKKLKIFEYEAFYDL